MIFFLLLSNINKIYSLTIHPFYLGNYILRKTNDPKLDNKYTYLSLNDNDIKLKTIIHNGIFSTKVSRNGQLFLKKNNFNIFNKYDNDLDLIVKFNNINKYTSSFCGVEFPKIKYENTTYNITKKINIKQKNNSLYIVDNNYYYLFDINYNIFFELQYPETSLNTLLFTQIISFIINILLVQLFSN